MSNIEEEDTFLSTWNALCAQVVEELLASTVTWDSRHVQVVPNLGLKLQNDNETLYLFDDASSRLVPPASPKVCQWGTKLCHHYMSGLYEDVRIMLTKTPVNTLYVQAVCLDKQTGRERRFIQDVIKL